MSDTIPPCPSCNSEYAYPDRDLFVCPECGNEWKPGAESDNTEQLIVKDVHGNQLQDGDHVTLIKDLKVKGSSSVAKIGTKVKINRLVDGDHNIDCKIDGIGQMMLKSEFVKKA
ncbi:zinc ribbon domain-containing protein YjdM [Aliikangiella sp. G2MR2-5]|uniref:zinc ribbon domain-containing protein YjdM n=1 Tax=Aliikangiella sp. G2MR2-5 TaxID=2788943 RepID=UPI0018A8D21C|nr:zinc ribbon domain-containing protein YjdM [Aliikangiella sp. G2MR2-5]